MPTWDVLRLQHIKNMNKITIHISIVLVLIAAVLVKFIANSGENSQISQNENPKIELLQKEQERIDTMNLSNDQKNKLKTESFLELYKDDLQNLDPEQRKQIETLLK